MEKPQQPSQDLEGYDDRFNLDPNAFPGDY